MTTTTTAPAAETPPAITQADVDAARTQGATSAIEGERTRIAGLIELDAESSVSEHLAAAIAEGTTVADFALGRAKAAKDQQAAALAAAQNDAAKPGVLPVKGSSAAEQPGQTVNRGKAAVERLSGKHPGLMKQA